MKTILSMVSLLALVIQQIFTWTPVQPTKLLPDRSTTLSDYSLMVDGASVLLSLPFVVADFISSGPDELVQIATSYDPVSHFEISLLAIPNSSIDLIKKEFGESLLVAPSYIDGLQLIRNQQASIPSKSEIIQLFGTSVEGISNKVVVEIGIHKRSLVIDEWVVEKYDRIWILRISQLASNLDTTKEYYNQISLSEIDASEPSISGDLYNQLLNGGISSGASLEDEPVYAAAADLPAPSWWSGDCDVNNFAGSFPLGGSYRNVKACGPLNTSREVYFGAGVRQYEWQCPELSKRYLYLAYNVPPYSANGKDVVANYPGSNLEKISNGTPNKGPNEGDILSYGPSDTYGHTSIVSSSDINSSGNGTITIIEQNWSTSGTRVHTVSNWSVQASMAVISWLHDPSTSTSCPGPSQNSPSDGYVSSSQSITFSWNAPSGCTYQGYTFRVKDTSNMDSGGTTLIDEGQGGTSVSKTFGTEWNNRDLYWGVRTANPLSPNWSIRRFRIGESPPPTGSWNAKFQDGDSCWWNPDCGQWTGSAVPRCETTINGALNVNYGTNAPCGGMSGDNWAGNYTSTINFSNGNYVFYLDHDDGAKFWINGTNRGDFGGSGNNMICNGTGGFPLSGNQNLRVLLREEGGDARVNLSWNTDTSVCTPPAAPSNLVATTVSQSQINLSWTDNSWDETNFRVERSPTGNDNWSEIATVSANTTSYSNTGLSTNTRYYYRVRAYRSSGDRSSDPSNVANAITGSPLQAPSNLSITAPTSSQLTLTWSDNSSDESNFRVERSANGTSGWNEISNSPANTTTFSDTALSPNTTYYYRVRAYRSNDNSFSGYSNTASGTTSGGAPAVPANFRFTGKTGSTLTMSWDDVSNETGYRIYKWNGESFVLVQTLGANTTSFTDTGLVCLSDYFYELAAYNSIGESDHAGWISDTTSECVASCPAVINYWKGEYWTNPDLAGSPGLCRDDLQLDFEWEHGSPSPEFPSDEFSARWTKVLNFPTGTYRFHLSHDDGGRIFIDDVLRFDGWETCCSWEEQEIAITEGNHDVRVEMNEHGYGAHLMMWYEPINITGWRGEYYNNMELEGNPAVVRDDAVIDFGWDDGSPHPLVRNDNFSVRWTRSLNFTAGEYTFTFFHDDGARLFIDDELVGENWCTNCVEEDQAIVTLSAGQHTIRYEMVENAGSAAASLSWTQQQDTYEPDNSSAEAKVITHGQPQTHNISPVGDMDWVTFTLTQESNVVLETSGPSGHDTEIYLYNTSVTQIDSDDNTGVDSYSRLDRICGTDPLPTGTYFARINERGSNAAIPSYQIALTAQPCAGAFAKSTPANGASGQATSLTLDWGNSANATSYDYCYDTTNDAACTTWINTGSTSQATISGLANGTTYYWQVRANNPLGSTYANNGTWWNFLTSGNPPDLFGKTNPLNGAIDYAIRPTLRWDSSVGASRYEYCIDSTNDNACSNWISTGTETSVMVLELANNTTYYWQVRAVNSFGTTYANGTANAYWNFRTIPLPPTGFNKVSPTNGANNQPISIVLDWGDSSNAARYEYCYDSSNDNACSNWVSTGTTSQVSVSGLNYSTTYYWQSRAINSAATTYANGSETAYWNFTTQAPPVSPPGAFYRSAPANNATNQPISTTLDWGDSTGATRYEYCYDTSNDSSCTNWVSTGTTSQVALSGLAYSTNYYWHVRGVNSAGTTYADGVAITFWRFTTQAQPVSLPGAFNKSAPQTGATNQPIGLTLNWEDSSGATAYEYCYDTSNDNNCSGWVSAGSTSQASISGLGYSTTYYWQARATNSAGTTYANGSAASYWSFTTQSPPVNPPGAFVKNLPSNQAPDQPTSLTLDWGDSTGAASYEYCYDTSNDNVCSNWQSAGSTSQASISGLNYSATYYWQVRAINSAGTTYANGSTTAYWMFTTGIPVDGVVLAVDPSSVTATLGQNFTLDIQVRAGTRQVDGASAYINFNPAHLNVVSITPGNVFTNTLETSSNNTTGQVNFSAGSLSNFPTGTFTLATITFRPLVQVSQTTLTFNSVNPRKSDATFGGASILGSTVNGTVTITQSSTINASVILLGRAAKPDPSWSVPLTIDLTPTGQTTPLYRLTPTSDNRGAFTLTDIQPGTYRAAVKNSHTLQVVQNITVQTGTNTAEFGPLPEGDANNDNYVTLLDFSILANTYGRAEGTQGFDGRADFNEDNYITLLDFSLLATNFGDSGSAVSGLATTANASAAPGQYANLIMEPGSQQVLPGETFTVTVMVESGDDDFDSAQASINFDPALLQVVALKGNTTVFPMALLNDFDNTLGTIDYAAGAVDNFPHGRVQLVEIEFRAKSTDGTTAITFNQTGVRKSDVAFAGTSILANIESASILIGAKQYFFIPLVEFGK